MHVVNHPAEMGLVRVLPSHVDRQDAGVEAGEHVGCVLPTPNSVNIDRDCGIRFVGPRHVVPRAVIDRIAPRRGGPSGFEEIAADTEMRRTRRRLRQVGSDLVGGVTRTPTDNNLTLGVRVGRSDPRAVGDIGCDLQGRVTTAVNIIIDPVERVGAAVDAVCCADRSVHHPVVRHATAVEHVGPVEVLECVVEDHAGRQGLDAQFADFLD